MTQQVRVQDFTITQDGYVSDEEQTLEQPFGNMDVMRLLGWALDTASHPYHGNDNGSRGLDAYFIRDFDNNIGAEIMGQNKFGPVRGAWEHEDWKGWWGDNPPFHTPVFVLTHFPRPSITFSDTTFHFINAGPHEALEIAKASADGKDIRIGGGVATVRQFLEADLIAEMHIAVAPFTVGSGERLWKNYDHLRERFLIEEVASPSGITHLIFWRN